MGTYLYIYALCSQVPSANHAINEKRDVKKKAVKWLEYPEIEKKVFLKIHSQGKKKEIESLYEK